MASIYVNLTVHCKLALLFLRVYTWIAVVLCRTRVLSEEQALAAGERIVKNLIFVHIDGGRWWRRWQRLKC